LFPQKGYLYLLIKEFIPMPKKFVLSLAAFLCGHVLLAQQPTISSFSPTSAPQGTQVSINGSNFTNVTAVSFGGVPAAYFFTLSTTQLIAVLSSAGASGNVSVTTATGTATRAGFTFLLPPAVNSFLPDTGRLGTVVTIRGQRFTGATGVWFGGVPPTAYTVLSDTVITATVGNGGSGFVSVASASGFGSKAGFVHTGPVITGFAPTAGPAGTVVTLTGINFTGATGVSFGNTPAASFTLVSPTTITATTAAGSAGNVTVATPDGAFSRPSFNLPVLQSNSPGNGTTGTVVTIKGYNFLGATGVSFGNVNAASFTVPSDTVITAVVGNGAQGRVVVSNTYGSAQGSFFFFSYPPPTMASFAPTSGNADTVLTIRGTGFSSTTSVKIGNSFNPAYNFTVVSDSVITVPVGEGASGSIMVTTLGGQVSLPGFVFTGPRITSFFPASGTTGTKVTLLGSNLGAITAVTFGGQPAASFTVDSATGITATIGTGATGELKLFAPNGNASTFSFIRVPQISSFSPTSGPVGTTVTITGTDFDSIYTPTQVYFGAVKATILSNNGTQLVVKVPPGATYEPIKVMANWHSGYANNPFRVTFSNANQVFASNSFAPAVNISPFQVGGEALISDLDGDGRPDFVTTAPFFISDWAFAVFRNTATSTALGFDQGTKFSGLVGSAGGLRVSDLDGDGLPEVMMLSMSGASRFVTVFRNNSTPGNMTFGYRTDHPVGASSGFLLIADMDGDGKNDIVTANDNMSGFVSVLHNRSSMGNVQFAPRTDYPMIGNVRGLALGDMTGDGKPDIIATAGSDFIQHLSIFKNVSTPGYPSFAPRFDYRLDNVGLRADPISSADLDGDDKKDIILASMDYTNFQTTLAILKNNGANGNVSFAAPVTYPAGRSVYGSKVADLDGDGRPDLLTTKFATDTISVYKNTTTGGTISLAAPAIYRTGNRPIVADMGDLNADGKPDMLVTSSNTYTATVLLNKIGVPSTVELCPSTANTTLPAFASGASYQWQANINDGNGFVNLSDNGNYVGTASASLQMVAIPSAWYGYQYRCLVNGNIGDVFQLKFANSWVGTASQAWENPANWSCGRVPDSHTDVVINSGSVVLNSNVIVRSLTVRPGASFTVSPGFSITITN
jgi:large repetitive protein